MEVSCDVFVLMFVPKSSRRAQEEHKRERAFGLTSISRASSNESQISVLSARAFSSLRGGDGCVALLLILRWAVAISILAIHGSSSVICGVTPGQICKHLYM